MTENINNPYVPPQAELISACDTPSETPHDQVQLYSPLQIRTGSFFFGPLAGVWFLKSNFDSMGKSDHSRKCVKWGIAVCVLILAIMLMLPERFPNVVLPLAYSYLSGYFAETYQLKKAAITQSDHFTFQSNWKVVGHGFIALIIMLIIAFGLLFSTNALGLFNHA